MMEKMIIYLLLFLVFSYLRLLSFELKLRFLHQGRSISALLTMPKPPTVRITINCGKFWKRWEYQTTWPASWENYMQVRKQQLELWTNRLLSNRKKSTSRLYIVTLLFNSYAEYIMRNAGLEEAQAGIKISRRNINNLKYADDNTFLQKVKEN